MSRYRKIFNKAFTSLLFISILFFCNDVLAQEGEKLFKANCANCHKPDADFTGPALQGWSTRVPKGDWIYEWIHNPAAKIGTDPYATALQQKWKTVMTAFPQLDKTQIDAIMAYVDAYTPPPPPGATAGGAPEQDNSLLFGILTLVLALVAFILLQVNSNLRKLTDEKEGIFRGGVYASTYAIIASICVLSS